MYNLKNYKNEITAISKANNADIGVATEMFLTNIRNTEVPDAQYHYAGAEHIDYAALLPHYGELAKGKAEFLEAWGRELGYRQ